jgi:hypothetical protein
LWPSIRQFSVQSFCPLGLHAPPKYSARAPCAAKSQPITSEVMPNDRSDADESKSVKIAAVQASTRRHARLEGSVVQPRASTRRLSFWRHGHAPPITSVVAPNDRSDADESKSVEIAAVQASTRLHAPPEGSVVPSTRHHSLTRASTRRERSSRASTRRQKISTRLHAPDKLSARAIHAPSTDPGRFAPRASQTGLFIFRVRPIHGPRVSGLSPYNRPE